MKGIVTNRFILGAVGYYSLLLFGNTSPRAWWSHPAVRAIWLVLIIVSFVQLGAVTEREKKKK